jgi:hypothetical protein
MRLRPLLPFGSAAAALVLLATGGVAFSHGRGERTRGAVRPYTEAHAGVIAGVRVHGDARTRTRDGRTEVRVSAEGLPRHATLAARLVNGRCSDVGPAFKFDPSGPATRDNEVWLDLKTRSRGEAGDRLKVRPLPRGHIFSMVIHAGPNTDPGARIACGDLKPD